MTTERAITAGGLSLRLVLSSRDTETHSTISHHHEAFEKFADNVSSAAKKILEETLLNLPKKGTVID